MGKIPDPDFSDPCYGLVQQVYKGGGVRVRLYPYATHLSLFVLNPGESLDQMVPKENLYGEIPVKGQLVRFDVFLGRPRYLICEGMFRPGQLRRWKDSLKNGLSPDVVSQYNDLVDQKFLSCLSQTGERELDRLQRLMDVYACEPVVAFVDEVEKMLMMYLLGKPPIQRGSGGQDES